MSFSFTKSLVFTVTSLLLLSTSHSFAATICGMLQLSSGSYVLVQSETQFELRFSDLNSKSKFINGFIDKNVCIKGAKIKTKTDRTQFINTRSGNISRLQ
jgi:hypothetical protein